MMTSFLPTQHPYAQIFSCISEYQLNPPLLGVAWDGAGNDNIVWGGDFIQPTQRGFSRVAHFLPYPLPGGDVCLLEPRRSAIGLLYGCYGEAAFEMTDLLPMQAFTKPQLIILRKAIAQKINTPVTSSVGRMMDGVASLLGFHQYVSAAGQATLTLGASGAQSPVTLSYPFSMVGTHPSVIDWREIIRAIVADYRIGIMTPVIAAKFRNTLVEIIVRIAKLARNHQVVLAGDCFCNKGLIERAIRRLSAEGFTPYWVEQVSAPSVVVAVNERFAPSTAVA